MFFDSFDDILGSIIVLIVDKILVGVSVGVRY